MQERLDEVGGNPLLVPEAVGLPMCMCRMPYAGKACERYGCPTDLLGRVCGGHGNTSVGLIQNGTQAGEGCQCERLTGYFEEPFRSNFDSAARLNITRFYYPQYNRLYCGTILPSPEASNVQFLWQRDSDYNCYCTDDWKGRACTEGKCP